MTMSQTQPELNRFIDDLFGASDEEDEEVRLPSGQAPSRGGEAGGELFESDAEEGEERGDDEPVVRPSKKPKLQHLQNNKRSDEKFSRLTKKSNDFIPQITHSAELTGDSDDEDDAYESGEEVLRTAEDDAFIDSDDDGDIMAEYRAEQNFDDERPRPSGKKNKKQNRSERENTGASAVPDANPLSIALADMKKKKKAEWSEEKKAELVQEVLMLIDRAADEDEDLYREGSVPYMKLKVLPKVQQLVGNKVLQSTLLEYNLLTALNRWIEPKDKQTLPALSVRRAVYEMLRQLPCQLHHLKRQPAVIGKTVMKLLKHEGEIPANKQILNEIVEKWNRLIFNKSSDARSRVRPRALHTGPVMEGHGGSVGVPTMRRQDSVESEASNQRGFEELLSSNTTKSGDGFDRVRVPFSSGFQFTTQPVSKVDRKATAAVMRENAGGSKDTLLKKMRDLSGSGKKQQFRAISASLTGKDKA